MEMQSVQKKDQYNYFLDCKIIFSVMTVVAQHLYFSYVCQFWQWWQTYKSAVNQT